MGVKLLCGGRQNRLVDLMVTQNGKDHGSHFPRHMTDDRHVFEPFCGFLLVICAEHGIALYSDLRRHPDASAQIRRAPFGHMRVRSLELAGLVDRRIDANIGCELVRRRKTGDISDFAENDGSNDRSNAGNRRDRRIKALKQSGYFFFQSVSLSGERLDLVEHQENQRGIRAVTVFNAEAISCKLPEFTRLPLAEVTIAAVPEQLRQLMLYYNEPVPMFRGDARRPWIDIASEKLLQRHLGIVAMQEFLATQGESMDHIAAAMFLDRCIEPYLQFLQKKPSSWYQMLLPKETDTDTARFLAAQAQGMEKLRQKRVMHPELFGWEEGAENKNAKTLLDALYEEGLIPTYSFPKNVVSTYITDTNGIVRFEVSRGLDVAISECAPGRAIVVDKQTYQIGGLFSPDSVRRRGKAVAPARAYLEDPNYCKTLLQCDSCQWFGVERDGMTLCPSCGSKLRRRARQMIKPWGFAPKDGQQIQQAQLEEAYSFSKPPQYATVADAQSTKSVPDWKHLRMAQRTNQQLIMRNDGPGDLGFTICSDCGAAMPGEGQDVLKNVDRPYRLGFVKSKCRHMNTLQVDLGYDFLTDMLVLEFAVDRTKISSFTESMWIARAAQSLAEALRLTASKELDIEFTELVTGYRVRHGETEDFIDVYLYDSLSSGAGYAAAIGAQIEAVLQKTQMQLQRCTCASACYNCLKHYRNQMVHGQLDRFAALELLHWGKNGVLAPPVSTEKQVEYVRPLEKVLLHAGIELLVDGGMLRIRKKNHEKQLVVYPAMWACSTAPDIVYLSDAQIRFAKPYAASVLMDSL